MKIEIGKERPSNFPEHWPGQYEVFSHLEYAAGIPHVLFAVTTRKENGKPNVGFHAWSCFQGDAGGFFAILAGICRHTHTYANIRRTGEFCVNFLSEAYYDRLRDTIERNGDDEDEFAAGGFTVEPPTAISAPRIAESFLCLECRLKSISDISGAGISALVVGEVLNIAADEDCALGLDKKYAGEGFMFNIHSPKNLFTGEGERTGVATLEVRRTY
ncbi:MAG: flavin reductase family protein [Clostridiales bacterium]|jgi:flavin reductase (DIM6/NTAB) family NADH-FMN oxidoreductase RutF|nr:flavin reductase family protein [Clostridiales bacterium]